MTAKAIEKMIRFYNGNIHDIEHFLKVWGYAKTTGRNLLSEIYKLPQ